MLSDVRRVVRERLQPWWLREQALAAVTWVALRVLPSRRVALVHGWPDSEGNAVEVVRGLLRRYPGTICWLRNGDEPAVTLPDVPPGRVVSVRRNTLPAVVAAWRAEVTFFTHGLVTAVEPPRSRLVVNLWHGDGPKYVPIVPRSRSTVVVASTDLWARTKTRMFGVRRADVAVVGNPRLDSALDRPASETRRLLGLGADRVVLWMPTFRRGFDGRSVTWTDGDQLSETLREGIAVPDGVRLVVKPHPLETDDYSALGATVLTNEDLSRAGVTLMQLLAASDALMSDASSTWVDYLMFDRPIGFFLPDAEVYGDLRGYNVPDLRAVLPGPVLPDLEAAGRFLADVRDGRAEVPSRRPELDSIGYHVRLPVTDHLFDWLDDYQRARGARPLFSGDAPR